jgi:antitoxin (DNA-binding transcriptional repressor) of toxin-antitoxin stability system
LRYRTKDVLKAVERGETVTVLHRGKPKARIVAEPEKAITNVRSSNAFGMWKDRKDLKDVKKFVRNLRKGRFPDL